MKRALILFVRNPEEGKVKSRIAATAGEATALAIYQKLLHHTHSLLQKVSASKYVFYAEAIHPNDQWSASGYKQVLQKEGNLGSRMQQAFAQVFKDGYQQVVIIGSDCYELTSSIVNQAFEDLQNHDIVIGPAKDGGYYLLAMKETVKPVFEGIEWSTEKVFAQTLKLVSEQNYTQALLPLLSDVDTIDDVPEEWIKELHLHTFREE